MESEKTKGAVKTDGNLAVPPNDDKAGSGSAAFDIPPARRMSGRMIVGIIAILVIIIAGTFLITKSTTKKSAATNPNSVVAIAPAEVSITSHGFVPATVTVAVNQAVTWTNNDRAPHQVNSDPYPTDNGLTGFNDTSNIVSSGTYTYVFGKAGRYPYHDNLNPYTFKGTVIVK
jgi:plastocyanin